MKMWYGLLAGFITAALLAAVLAHFAGIALFRIGLHRTAYERQDDSLRHHRLFHAGTSLLKQIRGPSAGRRSPSHCRTRRESSLAGGRFKSEQYPYKTSEDGEYHHGPGFVRMCRNDCIAIKKAGFN